MLCVHGSFAAPQNLANGINTEPRIARPAASLPADPGNKKAAVNFINVSPNNGLSTSLKNKNNDQELDFDGSGDSVESVYQPFNGNVNSQNILRISSTTTTTTTTTPAPTTTRAPTTRRTTRRAPQTARTTDPTVQVYGNGALVRNDFGTHFVLGK